MIPYKAKYSGKEVEFDIPAGWHDITLGQLCRIAGKDNIESNPIQFVSAMIGEDQETVSGWPLELVSIIYEKLMQALGDDTNVEWTRLPMPIFIEFRGKEIKIPGQIGKAPAGGVLTIVEKIRQANGKGELFLAPECIAHILFEQFTGEHWEEGKAVALITEIESMPAVKCVPIAYFFLKQLKRKIKNGQLAYIESAKMRK